MNAGVAIIDATTGKFDAFVAVKEVIFPMPLADNPILVSEFVHAYELAVPVKLTTEVVLPLQTTKSVGLSTTGVGKTAINTVRCVP